MRIRSNNSGGARRRAFSLVELIAAIVIFLIIGVILVMLFRGYTTMMLATKERALATQRANTALSLLRVPIQNAGLGIPDASDSAMENSFNLTSYKALWSWQDESYEEALDSVLVSTSGDVACFLYSIPLGVKVDGDFDVFGDGTPHGGGSTEIDLDIPVIGTMPENKIPALYDGNRKEAVPGNFVAKNWVTFLGNAYGPVVGRMYAKKSDDTYHFYFFNPTNSSISTFSDINQIRADVAFVDRATDTFYLADVGDTPKINAAWVGGGDTLWKDFFNAPTPENLSALTTFGGGYKNFASLQVEGIVGIQFRMENRKLMTVHILARGESKNLLDRPHYTQEFIERWALSADDLEYVLEEVSAQWRMRNLDETRKR